MLVRRRGRLDDRPDGVAKTGWPVATAKSVGIEVRDTAPGLGGQVDGGRLLMRDVRVASLLVGDARDRAMARLFGVSKDQAGLLTLVVALMLAQAVHDKVESLLKPGGPPTVSDGMLAAASLRELVLAAARPASRDPFTSSVLTLAPWWRESAGRLPRRRHMQ